MQVEAIVTDTLPTNEPEAVTPEEEYEASLGEAVVWEEYFADKGV